MRNLHLPAFGQFLSELSPSAIATSATRADHSRQPQDSCGEIALVKVGLASSSCIRLAALITWETAGKMATADVTVRARITLHQHPTPNPSYIYPCRLQRGYHIYRLRLCYWAHFVQVRRHAIYYQPHLYDDITRGNLDAATDAITHADNGKPNPP